MPNQPVDANVRNYYDQNTRRFLSYGTQKYTRTIHRAVWGPGVQDHVAALHFVHEKILTTLIQHASDQELSYLQVLDLGCGVGASLFYLAKRFDIPFWGTGVTISPVQARLAEQASLKHGLFSRCGFVEADYLNLPFSAQFSAAYAVEAFAHTPQTKRFFAEAHLVLEPGGCLIVCDDTLSEKATITDQPRDKEWLDHFRWGWGVPGILSLDELANLACETGFSQPGNHNLTQYLRGRSLPTSVTRMFLAVVRRWLSKFTYWRSVAGGQALQHCLKLGLVEYRYMVFKKMV
jgi:SAM-dependent methyltransferase